MNRMIYAVLALIVLSALACGAANRIDMPPGVPQAVRHIITFESVGDNRAEMTVTEYGYTSDQAHDLSKAGMEQRLNKLAASLR